MVLDPTSSHGVLRALMSGIMAGSLIAKCLEDNRLEQQIIQHYCEWITQWFQHDVDKLRQLYKMLPNPPQWLASSKVYSNSRAF